MTSDLPRTERSIPGGRESVTIGKQMMTSTVTILESYERAVNKIGITGGIRDLLQVERTFLAQRNYPLTTASAN